MSLQAEDTPKKRGPPKGTRIGGRQRGTKNKTTISRELDLAEATKKRDGLPRAKDELLGLIPSVKTVVEKFYGAAAKEDGSGIPGGDNFDAASWSRFKEWVQIFHRLCNDAADFQDPRLRAMAVVTDPKAVEGVRFVVEGAPVAEPSKAV